MTLWRSIRGTLAALGVTLKAIFRRPATIPYPEVKRVPAPRYRARIVLTRDPRGGERCVACHLCSAACPVNCISMQAAEGPDGRRYAAWFRINFSRCIFCGLCAEACPTLAIQMTPDYELCRRDPLELVFEKEDLLVEDGGKDRDYDFYRHAGIGVAQARGEGSEEEPPADVRSLLP
ncbi:MAG TPA: NADH-quinone oxidoreductase subunit NuoI [Myxococcota bacterium]|nr:NADH-quinone oxidoreductase subunit NuoI [Myxococcota bacterium]HRY92720.1 NADH-quinone oxidoreductase subunit NuoI [Myxococcota bacterium]HSA23588.1 NADH-quinone oxidoreductase subunit NuoI [Myxococcota bacterium]